MAFQSGYRPTLRDMHSLRAASRGGAVEADLEAGRKGPRTSLPEMFDGRGGYDENFLGEFVVPMPTSGDGRGDDVLAVPGGRLDYTHFSVVMSKSRRIAMFVGVNISGEESVPIARTADKWSLDGRIAPDAQLGEEMYADNLLDRGHLVRREDPNWGEDAETANEDTFHFTNCAPQMGAYNQKTWLSLEDYVLKNTRRWKERVTVFSGPVFRDDDRIYRGIGIPTAFWKVIAFVSDNGLPSATAYMVDQSRELGSLEAAFGAFRTYQRSVRRIEQLTGLDFGELSRYDGFSNEERDTGTTIESAIRDQSDIRV